MRRRYSPDDKACALAALDANAGKLERTAHQLDIPRKTLERWARGEGRQAELVASLRHQKRRNWPPPSRTGP